MTIAEKLIRAKDDYTNVFEAGHETGYSDGQMDGYNEGFFDGYEDSTKEHTNIINSIINGTATKVVIPKGCNKITSYAFYYAKNIKEVSIESTRLDGVFYVAFAHCYGLEKFSIANKCNIRRFGEKSFYNCSSLKVIDLSKYSGVDIPRLDNINAFDGVHADCVIIVPHGLYGDWISATNWSAVADMIIAAY